MAVWSSVLAPRGGAEALDAEFGWRGLARALRRGALLCRALLCRALLRRARCALPVDERTGRVLRRAALGASVLVATLLVGGDGEAGYISGTKHDFTTASWNAGGDLCQVCHTPHGANPAAGAPLWDHQLTVSTFNPYPSGGTMQATPGQPGAASIICLSCHDGTVALDNYGGVTTGTSYITGTALVGTDLSNSHPIGFDYDSTLVADDGFLFDPTTTTSGITPTGTVAQDMLFGPNNTELQCPTCHNVHDNTYGFFLIMSNVADAMCVKCHNL